MNILYEDNHLLAVEKPYGVPSQADETGDKDMLSLCKAYIKEKYNKPGMYTSGWCTGWTGHGRRDGVCAHVGRCALAAQIKSGSLKRRTLCADRRAAGKGRNADSLAGEGRGSAHRARRMSMRRAPGGRSFFRRWGSGRAHPGAHPP